MKLREKIALQRIYWHIRWMKLRYQAGKAIFKLAKRLTALAYRLNPSLKPTLPIQSYGPLRSEANIGRSEQESRLRTLFRARAQRYYHERRR